MISMLFHMEQDGKLEAQIVQRDGAKWQTLVWRKVPNTTSGRIALSRWLEEWKVKYDR